MVSTRYLVDDKNRKNAIVLNLKDYKHLIALIEELEDALDLDNALRTKTGFRDYAEIRKELKEQGRL
ncbi:MAG: hypothetical protein HW384_1727 [Dehalococcoidia bacterium]|nr:hypothetical protein [Dehalococcoidia bacterium]